MFEIIPTILTKDKKEFEKKNSLLEDFSKVQIDIMDGVFVKEKSVSLADIKTDKLFEAHLMCKKPLSYLKYLKKFNCFRVIFHLEAVSKKDIAKTIFKIREEGFQVGLAINPSTDVLLLKDYSSMVDVVLFMSVNPGKEGQKFIDVSSRIKKLREFDKKVLVSVDGGINKQSISKLKGLINYANVGSFISKSKNKKDTLQKKEDLEKVYLKNYFELNKRSKKIRVEMLKALNKSSSGHTGGPLGMVEIFNYLYFNYLKINPKKSLDKKRDYLILSNGHICPVLYTTLAFRGFFKLSELKTLRKLGSKLQGHPHRGALVGIETTSGPLGSGLSQGSGMALALKNDGMKNKVVVLTSDGEHEEGNTWEAVIFAAKYKLDNLIQIIDRNYIQIDGKTEDVMPLGSLASKYKSFGWEVREINGHSYDDLELALKELEKIKGKPKVIVAHTTPGRGVSFMENKYEWHGVTPKDDELKRALEELK